MYLYEERLQVQTEGFEASRGQERRATATKGKLQEVHENWETKIG